MMEFDLPDNPSVQDRILAFNRYLDAEFERTNTLARDLKDTHSRLLVQTERAEISLLRDAFQSLFKPELAAR